MELMIKIIDLAIHIVTLITGIITLKITIKKAKPIKKITIRRRRR